MSIHHTKGALNAAADALSRYPLEGRPCAINENSPPPLEQTFNYSSVEHSP